MLFDKFVFENSDGTQTVIDKTVLTSVTNLTESVNSGDDITLGSACSSEVVFNCIDFNGNIPALNSKECAYYKVDSETNTETKIGYFICQKPERNDDGSYKITAYDRMSLLDAYADDWLETVTYPITLFEFATQLLAYFGLTLTTKHDDIPNADYQISGEFKYENVTGRTLLQYVGQICARFARVNADGNVEFAWYSEISNIISPSTVDYPDYIPYKVENGIATYQVTDNGGEPYCVYYPIDKSYGYYDLRYQEYATDPINKVQVKCVEDDIGVIVGDGTNAYIIDGNPLFQATTDAQLRPYVETIYNSISNISYVPLEVEISDTTEIHTGDIVTVIDSQNVSRKLYIMSAEHSGNRLTLKATGNETRSTLQTVNNFVQSTKQQMLVVKAGVDSLSVEVASKVGDDEVRSKFAMDSTSVEIDSGVITFNSNTIVINSTNFTLDGSGNVSITGTFKTTNSNNTWQTELDSGGIYIGAPGGQTRVSLFKAGNHDAGYLHMTGSYGNYEADAWYSPDGMSISKNSSKIFEVTPSGTISAVEGAFNVDANGDVYANHSLNADELHVNDIKPSGVGNCAWVYFSSLNNYVLVRTQA